MTQEEKAKAYVRAIEEARKIYNQTEFDYEKGMMEQIFPELKESENERIRKELLEHCRKQAKMYNTLLSGNEYSKVQSWITWIENLDETFTKKDVDDAYLKGISDAKNELEKQDENKKEINNFDVLPGLYKCVHRMFDGTTDGKLLFEVGNVYKCLSKHDRAEFEISYGHSVYLEDPVVRKHFIPFEKQGEQKSIDNTEPKFKVGDWVVYNNDICQIVKREEGCNKLVTIFGIEKELVNERNLSTARFWTIEDAKDGDVLAFDNDIIVIFKNLYDAHTFHSYCFIQDRVFDTNEGSVPAWWKAEHFYPATKEQHDTLFKAINDAGYEWYAEKKELKKIEQKPAIEPKFKVGDWITFYGGESFKILKIETEVNGILDYLLLNQNGHDSFYNKKYVDENARLWSIKDAKKGDILFQDLMDGKTFVFDGINPEMAILYSFIINNDGKDILPYDIGKPNTGIGYIEDGNIIYPATKEQCDLLFSKMKEAGYEWDAEKKEVKIIDWSKHIKYEQNGPSIIEEKPVNRGEED